MYSKAFEFWNEQLSELWGVSKDYASNKERNVMTPFIEAQIKYCRGYEKFLTDLRIDTDTLVDQEEKEFNHNLYADYFGNTFRDGINANIDFQIDMTQNTIEVLKAYLPENEKKDQAASGAGGEG